MTRHGVYRPAFRLPPREALAFCGPTSLGDHLLRLSCWFPFLRRARRPR